MHYGFDHRKSRPATNELMDLAEGGVIDWETLARDLLGWLSEDEVAHFARANDYIVDSEEEEEQ